MGAMDCVNKLSGGDSTEVFRIHKSSTTIDVTESHLEPSPTSNNGCKFNWYRLFVDIPILCLGALFFALLEYGFIPSHKAGFYCNDPSLSFPFTGDTVTPTMLFVTLGTFVPIVVFGTELLLDTECFASSTSRLKKSLKRTSFIYGVYLYGLLVHLMVVQLMKILLGSPRPSFFSMCRPDTGFTCNGSEFVTTFECTSTYSTSKQMDSYRSFPSGHTSTSVYTGLFIVWYLQVRAFNWRNRSTLIVPMLQLLAVAYSAICSLTRITDRRHHWWDVLAGLGIGVATVAFTVKILLNNFRVKSRI